MSEFNPHLPPALGTSVEFLGDETATAGVYTIVNTDDYPMVGFVVIEDMHGSRFGRDYSLMRPVAQREG